MPSSRSASTPKAWEGAVRAHLRQPSAESAPLSMSSSPLCDDAAQVGNFASPPLARDPGPAVHECSSCGSRERK
eukprot:43136-Pleurochrysis_carterae.AAC.2